MNGAWAGGSSASSSPGVLVGGDFYTAYTVIAVPALVYSVGTYGFFALPYTILVHSFVFAVSHADPFG